MKCSKRYQPGNISYALTVVSKRVHRVRIIYIIDVATIGIRVDVPRSIVIAKTKLQDYLTYIASGRILLIFKGDIIKLWRPDISTIRIFHARFALHGLER